MKAKSIIALLLTLVILAGITAVSLCGLNLFDKQYYTGVLQKGGLNLGIDLAGGASITFKATKDDVSDKEMEAVEAAMNSRVSNMGYTEANITRDQSVLGRITVEIPGLTDTEEAKVLLGSTAALTFRDSTGAVVLEGNDIDTASAKYGKTSEKGTSENYVELKLKTESVNKWYEATKANVGKPIYIFLDYDESLSLDQQAQNAVSAPNVNGAINSETCIINGNFDQKSAKLLASQINSGTLPVELKVESENVIGASLGEGALDSAMKAAGIGILLVMLFMLIFYRLPGLVADIALVGYVGFICLCLKIFNVNLSLSGIAGIILSIGMAVDANVIIFERIKEELNLGKTTKSAVDSGFHRALSAILDGNITTLIAVVVLYLSGVSTVRGFAVTLGLGVVLSMLTAVVITRLLLKQIVNLNVKNRALYGAKTVKKEGGMENA